MGYVYAFGETVYDIIFGQGQPQRSVPGGAMLNTAVSLGRMKLPVRLITEYGKDHIGEIIEQFLCDNNIDTQCVHRFDDGKTAVALAFLDEKKNARYSFYKLYPKQRFSRNLPKAGVEDYLLFGSFYSLQKEIRGLLVNYVEHARKEGALVIYDPNMRIPHKKEISKLRYLVDENISLADIVRGSDEDFHTIYGAKTVDDAFRIVKEKGGALLIYTMGERGLTLMTERYRIYKKTPALLPVSTIGAGDSFNAGIIYALFQKKMLRSDLPSMPQEKWSRILDAGIAFASEACLSIENYISYDFAAGFSQPG